MILRVIINRILQRVTVSKGKITESNWGVGQLTGLPSRGRYL